MCFKNFVFLLIYSKDIILIRKNLQNNRLLKIGSSSKGMCMNQEMADEISRSFESITGVQLDAKFMQNGDEHKPTTLQQGKCGVYAFMNEKRCFKVGKAGANSPARWNSHHYNLDGSTPSTMPKSIQKHTKEFKAFFPEGMHSEIEQLKAENIKGWVKNNLSRMEFLIDSCDDATILNLLEAIVQFNLKPLFEGGKINTEGNEI